MRDMGWSWEQLQATPLQVRLDVQACLDAVNSAQQAQAGGGRPQGVPIDPSTLPGYEPPPED